jgi:protocatechuate 3,4-dioxygenase alpha subunit
MTMPITTISKHITTPSQTVGPYLHIGLDWLTTSSLVTPETEGQHIVLQGRLLDTDGQPIPDGMIEIWQANAHGKYAHPDDHQAKSLTQNFMGFGRLSTDEQGGFRFSTIKPGPVPHHDDSLQASHIMVQVFARGLIKQLVTRVYFPDDDHSHDLVLKHVPVERRHTLVATTTKDDPNVFHWNIALGGENETVFFTI